MTESERSTKIRVEANEALPELLDRLRGLAPGDVTLEVPEHCPLLLTATEFRALKSTAGEHDLNLTLDTEDRLRRQLAGMFGLAVAGEPELPATGPAPSPERRSAPPGGLALSGWRRARREAGAAEETAPSSNGAGDEDPIAVSRRRRTSVYEPGFAGQERTPKAGATENRDGAGALDYLDGEVRRGISARALGSIVGIVAVAALAAAVAAWYLMPGVTVNVTLEQTPVSTDLIYTVAAPGAAIPSDASFAVEAAEDTAAVRFTYTIPTTGVRREPDQTAAGVVELRNPGDEPVTVEAGAALTTLAGGDYVTTETVEVPAQEDEAPGQVEAPVRAAEPGTGGNLPQGYLTGKLAEQDIFYSNRTAAIEGGTDREVALVSEQDVTAIREGAEANLRQLTADAWAAQLPEGRALVEPSVVAEALELTVADEVGAEADMLTLRGRADATGLVYSLADVQRQAKGPVEERLGEQVPSGYRLDAGAVVLGEPTVIGEGPESRQYQVTATGVARAIFTEEEQERLLAALVEMSPAEAEAAVAAHPAVAAVDLDYAPSWWLERLPRVENRIAFDLREGSPPVPAGTPPSTPAEGVRAGQNSASTRRPQSSVLSPASGNESFS